MLSAVTTSLLVCVVKLYIWYVAVCCLCVRVPDVHQARTSCIFGMWLYVVYVCACLMYLSV